MEMCFHGNQISWGITHPIISLCCKYHSPGFICLSIILSPVISSLDGIYCRSSGLRCSWMKLKEKIYNIHTTIVSPTGVDTVTVRVTIEP